MPSARSLFTSAAAVLILLDGFLPASASCRKDAGFPVYQCGDRGYFDPPPEGSGLVSAVFWQIGFGNALVNNGTGRTGIGIAPPGVFSGNDSGLLKVPLVDARSALAEARVPEGAICLGPVNWKNLDIDGCCDNARDPNMLGAMDGLLNPNLDPRVFAREGIVVPAPERVQDYPMAVLLREETARYFAVAAAASGERPDLRDFRPGGFSFGDVTEGKPNVLNGARNVIPWQRAPEVRLVVLGPSTGGKGTQWRVRAGWEPAVLPSDASHRPSEAFGIDNPGHGAGVADMGPLVSYEVQRVRLMPDLVSEEGFPVREALPWEEAVRVLGTEAEVDVEEDACVRVVVNFGRIPRTRSISAAPCALGRCGDIGFGVAGPPLCLEGPLLRALAAGKHLPS